MRFDRETYFDMVRENPFGGSMTQEQVDGQEAVLREWEALPLGDDLRWLSYPLATDYHETAQTMQPIEEYGKGAGHDYGKTDPETGQAYYGRGLVQLTHRANYQRATDELGLTGDDDLVWHADRALDPTIASEIMFRGMSEGWFRSGHTLSRYFNDDTDDAYGAREIINGDKHIVPSWSHGVSIGNLIAGYHNAFLAALEASARSDEIEPEPDDDMVVTITLSIDAPPGVRVHVDVKNGETID